MIAAKCSIVELKCVIDVNLILWPVIIIASYLKVVVSNVLRC